MERRGGWIVKRAPNAEPGFVQNMRINHRRSNIFVSEESLDGSDIVTAFQQMGGEAMPESMAAGCLGNTGGKNGFFYCVLKIFLRDVMTADFSAARVERGLGRWEDVLPDPGTLGIWIFTAQCGWEVDFATSASEIALVQLLDPCEVGFQWLSEPGRENSNPFAKSFAATDRDLVVAEIDVFNPKAHAFH